MRIMCPTFEDAALFPLKEPSEKTRISDEFLFSFWYFRPSFDGLVYDY